MQNSRIAHTLREQFQEFAESISGRLSKPMARFVGEMVYGISASSDVKLSNIGRALQETIALKKTEERLSRNLQQDGLGQGLNEEIARAGARISSWLSSPAMSHAWPNASSEYQTSIIMPWRMASPICWPGAPKAPSNLAPQPLLQIPNFFSSPLHPEKMGNVLSIIYLTPSNDWNKIQLLIRGIQDERQ